MKTKPQTHKTIGLLLLCMLISLTMFGSTVTWNGSTSNAWGNALNWTGGLPTAGVDVLIPATPLNGVFPVISTEVANARKITINTGASVTMSGGTLDIYGDLTNDGSFASNSGTVTFRGTNKLISGSNSSTFSALVIANAATISMSSNVTCASFTIASGASATTFSQSGSAAFQVNGTATVTQPTGNVNNSWNINTGSATVTGSLVIGGTATGTSKIGQVKLTTGTLTVQGNVVYNSPAGVNNAILDMSAGASVLNLAGNMVMANTSGKLVSGNTSQVKYTGNAAQIITLGSGIVYNDIYTLNTSVSGITLGAAMNSWNCLGNLRIQSGSFSNGGFTMAGNSSKTFELLNTCTFHSTGNAGFVTGFGTKTIGSTSTVVYEGSNQTIGAENYGNLSIAGSGTKTFAGATVVNGNFISSGSALASASSSVSFNGNLTIGVGSTFNANAAILTLKGNFSNNGTFSAGTSTVVFSGATAQTISGASTFKNCTINNTNGIAINSTTTINGVLSFITGKISTGSQIVYMTSSSSVSGASASTGYVYGNLKKDLAANATSLKFEIGDATVYAPLNYASMFVTSAGTVTAFTTAGDHANLASSSFVASRTVNRTWTLSASSAAVSSASVTAQFATSDCDAGINTAFNEIALWNGTAWTYPTAGIRTTTSSEATGINGFSTIQIAERYVTPVLSSITPAIGNRLQTMNVSFSGSGFATGVSAVNVGSGITVNSTTINSTTSITANITIASNASTGSRNFTVSTPAGVTSAAKTFTINNPVPVLTQANVSALNRYESANVILLGNNFISGVTTLSFGAGVVVNSFSVINATTIHANISITANATAGTRAITALNAAPVGGTSNALAFNVTAIKIFSLSSGAWNNAASWLPASAPTAGESISIPANAVCVIPAGVTATVDSMTVNGHLTIENGASLVCAGKLTQSASGSLTVSGDMPTFSSSSFNGTTEFNGSADQAIPANISFYDVLISGAGMKTLTGSTVFHDLVIDGSLATSGIASDIKISGALAVNGSFGMQSSTVIMNGTAAQTISGNSIAFNNLSIMNTSASGVALQVDAMLKGVLTLGNNAKFITTGFPLTLSSDAEGTASIAAIPASASIQGDIVMERYLPVNTGYTMLGSAVNAPMLQELNDDFIITGVSGSSCSTCPANIWFYNEAAAGPMNNEYVVPASINSNITNGRGVFTKRPSTAAMTIDMQGTPNNGALSIPVTYTQSTPPRPNDDGWFLASNPYPSAIDWESAAWTKTNISSTIYTWDAAVSDYRTYQTGMGGMGSRYIASSQAFWVKATGANPVLSLTEQVKSTNTPVYRLNNTMNDAITLRIQQANQTDLVDETYIRFRNGSVSSYEPEFDSHRLLSASSIIPNIATVSLDSALLSINTMGALDHNLAIPVVVRVNTAGSYVISAPSLDQFAASACIILDDLQTGVKTNLREQSYTVTIGANTSNTARFMLRIAPPIKTTVFNSTCAGAHDGKIVAQGQSNGPWSYVWKNAVGQVIRTAPAAMFADSISNLGPGKYSVSITNAIGYCSVITEESEVAEPAPINGQPSVSNITCHGKGDGQIRLVPVGGSAPYEFHWETGANTQDLNNLNAGSYKVMITDQNLCVNYHVIEVHEPAALSIAMNVHNIDFCNTAKGMIEASIDGGTAPYSYTWSNASSATRIEDLNEGKYSLVVLDANGCSSTQASEIVKANVLHAEFAINADTVFLSNGGQVQFANRSEGVNEYRWNFGDGTSSTDANPVHTFTQAGTYEVQLTAGSDACQQQFSMQVMVLRSHHDDLGSMTMWPNPNPGDKVYVDLDGAIGQEIKFVLYNLNGTRLMERSLVKSAGLFELDFTQDGGSQLTPGSYLLSAIIGGKSISKKLVVKR